MMMLLSIMTLIELQLLYLQFEDTTIARTQDDQHLLFQGIMTEMKRSLVIVLKLDKKTINIKLTINGDFLVQVITMIMVFMTRKILQLREAAL